MSIPYEKIVAEDLNQGYGSVSVTLPGGGSATGTKVGLHTWSGWHSVKDHGAVGDGVTDDTAAIQSVLDLGVPTYLPPGTYLVTGLTINQDTTVLAGAGIGKSTLKGLGSNPIITITANYPEIHDFAIVGNASTPYGIKTVNAGIQGRYYRLDIATVLGTPGAGFGTSPSNGNGYSMHFHRCRVSGCKIGLSMIGRFQYLIIDECIVIQNTQRQISLVNGENFYTRMVSIVNCDIEGAGAPGSTVYGVYIDGIDPVSIMGCYFESSDNASSADIYVTASGAGGGASPSRVNLVGCYSNANITVANPIILNTATKFFMSGCYYFNSSGDTILNMVANGKVQIFNSVLNFLGHGSQNVSAYVASEGTYDAMQINGPGDFLTRVSCTGSIAAGLTTPLARMHIRANGLTAALVFEDDSQALNLKTFMIRDVTQQLQFGKVNDDLSNILVNMALYRNGYVGINTVTDPTVNLEVNGGIRINTTQGLPAAGANYDGVFWVVKGGAGVKDQVLVCAKDAADVYAWRTIY